LQNRPIDPGQHALLADASPNSGIGPGGLPSRIATALRERYLPLQFGNAAQRAEVLRLGLLQVEFVAFAGLEQSLGDLIAALLQPAFSRAIRTRASAVRNA
jgi:hypothetical protein